MGDILNLNIGSQEQNVRHSSFMAGHFWLIRTSLISLATA